MFRFNSPMTGILVVLCLPLLSPFLRSEAFAITPKSSTSSSSYHNTALNSQSAAGAAGAGGGDKGGESSSSSSHHRSFVKRVVSGVSRTQENKAIKVNGGATAPPRKNGKRRSIMPGMPGYIREPKSEKPISVDYIAETNLPTDIGSYRLRAYRIREDEDDEHLVDVLSNKYTGTEPCVIYCASQPPGKLGGSLTDGEGELCLAEAVPVRIHDQCFTSEVFRSQRCDCKEQLKMSLEFIQRNGGAIIYLQQEGRGIGLANKIHAYQMQDEGMDTVEANLHLGFPEDARVYGCVPSILKEMGIGSIQLMTNNPRKIDRLSSLGVNIVNTIPMVVPKIKKHYRRYIETKVNRMNHLNFATVLDETDVEMIDGKLVPKATINSGDSAAAYAIVSAFEESDSEEFQEGVVAASDGYCFGRKSVENAIAAVARGEIVCIVDDMSRENEGDLIMAADMATPEKVAEIVRYTSGLLCVGMEGRRMDELKLPPMVQNNEDPKATAFSVSVDAKAKHGITTGISAYDRSKTLMMLASDSSVAGDFHRPGHIFPLRAVEGGVLERDGHTEAAVDISRMAGRHPSGLLCEIVSQENPLEMARLPELKEFCKKNGYVLTSIADMAQYRRDTNQ